MSHFDETFDYLTMLGLNPATVPLDAAALAEIVKRKKKEWTGQAINPLYQQQARANLERARQFEQLARDPAALEAYVGFLRETQAAQRGAQEREMAGLIALAVAGRKKELTTAQRDLLIREAESRQIPTDVVDSIITSRKLTVIEGPAAATTNKLPYKSPALDRALVAQINGSLRVLGKKSFYELLDLPMKTSPPRIASTAQLLFGRWSKALPKTTECIAWEKSLQACLTYLKDEESKAAYDRALFNGRLDEFVRRIDLVLAAGRFTKEGHALLAQIGTQEFGLPNGAVNQCINVRAAATGVSLTKPLAVTIQFSGHIQCSRCFRWNAADTTRCTGCGGRLALTCFNPECGETLTVDAKVCHRCGLPVARGGQYAELLRLIDASLETGNARAALDACGLAQQIIPSQAIADCTTRANDVRTLMASIKRAIADKQWTKVYDELQRLLALSPRLSQPGIPALEEVAQYVTQIRKKIDQQPEGASAEEVARFYLACLAQWTDSAEITQKLSQLADVLEADAQFDAALEVVNRLAELHPLNEIFQEAAVRIGHKAAHLREEKERRREALQTWERALTEKRLYAAERALATLTELDSADDVADESAKLRAQLAQVRAELLDIQQTSQSMQERDPLILRYFSLLERCRDCREALAALQNMTPDAPAAPENIRVTVEGNRRTVTWNAPTTGKTPTSYVVERSILRPGSRQGESPYTTVYEGGDTHCVDDEVAHSGTILRYTVQSISRGTLEVVGHTVQEFRATSPPVPAEPLLMWHEVLGLRIIGVPAGIELHWHQPAGVRQVLIERWNGEREASHEGAVTLSADRDGQLLDKSPEPGQTYSYRLCCVYDGPEGDFLTTGVIVTARAPAASPSPVTDASDASLAAGTLADLIADAPPVEETVPPKEPGNPLKRFGLWPPAAG